MIAGRFGVSGEELHIAATRYAGLANARDVRLHWDRNVRMMRVTDAHGGATDHYYGAGGYIYSYDAVGNLARLKGADGETGYRYDPTGRLLEAVSPRGAERFAYDAAGNPFDFAGLSDRQKDPSSKFYTPHVTANRLVRHGGVSYRHERGNVVERTRQGETQRYEWDAFDRMVSAETAAGKTRYYHDALGRRIAKLRTDGSWQWFGWDGDRLAFETTDSEATHYLYEPGAFAPLAQVGVEPIGSTPLYEDHWYGAALPEQHPQPWRSLHFHHTDHLGTPRELTDGFGRLSLTMTYKAWGEATATPAEGAAPDATTPFRFQGQYHDPETGLHYNRHRTYDPALGRFLSTDPIGFMGGTNLYAYAPNPTGWVDPLGLAPTNVPAGSSGCNPGQNQGCGGFNKYGIPTPAELLRRQEEACKDPAIQAALADPAVKAALADALQKSSATHNEYAFDYGLAIGGGRKVTSIYTDNDPNHTDVQPHFYALMSGVYYREIQFHIHPKPAGRGLSDGGLSDDALVRSGWRVVAKDESGPMYCGIPK